MKPGYAYSYNCIVFDQNGDAYYVWNEFDTIDGKNIVVQNRLVSIFGDKIKTNNVDVDLKIGDLVIL